MNMINDKTGAMEEFRKAIRYKKDLFQAHYNLANSLYYQGAKQESLKEYDTALALYPTYASGYLMRPAWNTSSTILTQPSPTWTIPWNWTNADTQAYVLRGKTYYMLKDNSKACNDWIQQPDMVAGKQNGWCSNLCTETEINSQFELPWPSSRGSEIIC